MSLLSGIVSLLRDTHPSVQVAANDFNYSPRNAGDSVCSLVLPRAGVWQIQINALQAASDGITPSRRVMDVRLRGTPIFTPSVTAPGSNTNQFIQVQAESGDVVDAVYNCNCAGYMVCDL